MVQQRPPSLQAEMPFIFAINSTKDDPTVRKLIRSHVMKRRKLINAGPSKKQRTAVSRPRAVEVKLKEVIETYTPLVPSRIGSDFSFSVLADKIEPLVLLKIAKGLKSNGCIGMIFC